MDALKGRGEMTNQAHGTVGEAHRQTAMEILACLPDSPLWRDTEVCSLGAQYLAHVLGNPAGQWGGMNPISYAVPIGHVSEVSGADCDSTVLDQMSRAMTLCTTAG